MDNLVIDVIELTKKYRGRTALDHVNLQIRSGEVFGLMGPNGAGKSTFIALLASLLKPTSGDILLNGSSIMKDARQIRSIMGYVPQDLALYPMLSAEENLAFWAGIYRIPRISKKKAVTQALLDVQLHDRAKDKVSSYSGGMKRRLNIAASLMHNPQLLVMDEPTAGVDVFSRKCIAEMIVRYRETGRTVVLTSHYVDELESVCDRMAVIQNGRIRYSGTLQELLGQADEPSLETIMLKMGEGDRHP
jgi:ABC-2 type transport system ATP-binding protein